MNSKVFVFLFFCFLLISNISIARTIGEMSQEEMKEALSNNFRCALTPTNDESKASGKVVKMITVETQSGDNVYFAEVFKDNDEVGKIFYLPKTHLTLGGYKSEGKRQYRLGLKIDASVNHLSQMNGSSGTDVTITISDHVGSSEEKYYAYCNF